jgi:hypothetical protein
MRLLHPKPQSRTIPAEFTQTYCHLRRYRNLTAKDAVKHLAGNPKFRRSILDSHA